MQLSPKPLTSGWIKRCAVNALKVSLRSPLLWLILYVGIPILTYFVPYLPLMTFAAGMIIIMGTLLCFSSDHLGKYGLKDFLSLLIIKPQLLIILLTSVITSLLLFSSVFSINIQSPLHALYRFGVAIMSLYVSVMFSSVTILLFYDIPSAIFKFYKFNKKGDKSKDIEDFSINGKFSVFGLHLSVDTNLDWYSACTLSEKGVEILKFKDRMILLAPISILFIFPILLGFFVPFYYFLYRELFWGEGLSDRHKVVSIKAAYTT